MKSNENLIPYAIVDHMHIMIKELFQSLPKTNKNQRMHIIANYGENEIEIRGFSQLGAFDLSILQSIIGMAGEEKKFLETSPTGKKGKELREKLELEADAITEKSMVVTTSYRKIIAETGNEYSGKCVKLVQNSLFNLCNTLFIVRQKKPNKKTFGFNMISTILSSNGKLTIALNPLLSSAIVGERNFAKIHLTEARKIKSNSCKLLHSRLSGLITPGAKKTFKPETLASYIWPNEATPSTMRKRLSRLEKEVLPELQKINWIVKPKGNLFQITRCATKKIDVE